MGPFRDIGIVTSLAPPPGQPSSPLVTFLPFVLIAAVFYLVVFRPMRAKQKQHLEMLQQLKAGDRVVTSGGIHGTVVGVTSEIVQLRVADQVKIDVSKSAVTALIQNEG